MSHEHQSEEDTAAIQLLVRTPPAHHMCPTHLMT